MTGTYLSKFGNFRMCLGKESKKAVHARGGSFHAITIHLSDGGISEADIEDKVRETFRQMGVEVDIE